MTTVLVREESTSRRDSFSAFLNRLGVKPFTPESVLSYKAAVIARFSQTYEGRLIRKKRLLGQVTYGSICVSIAIALVYSSLIHNVIRHEFAITVATWLGCLFLTLSAWLVVAYARTKAPQPCAWQRINLDYYKKAIPEPARQVAERIWAVHPTATIWVEEFDTDPLMGTTCGDIEYYFYVWEEPGFVSHQE